MAYTSTPGGQFVNVLPDQAEDPNIPVDLSNLAKAIEKRVMGVYATTAARDSAATAMGVQEGMFAYTADTDSVWFYSGSAWIKFPPAITSGTSVPSNSSGNNGDIFFQV